MANGRQPLPTTIQRYPRGLVGALDIKDRSTPSAIDDRLSLVFDTTEFYLHSLTQTFQSNAGSPIAIGTPGGGIGPITVPERQLWLLRLASVNLETAVAETMVRAILLYRPEGTTASVRVAMGVGGAAGGAGDRVCAVWQPSYPLLLRPGSTITGQLASQNAGAITGVVSAVASVIEF